ncbi:MAG: hypothetical protein V1753_11140 [Pseudomonadota bacterium]
MKKQPNNPESVLARAERLFERGNYLVACQEFEKVKTIFQQHDIAEKIKICEKEIAQLKVKELSKLGDKHARKGDLKHAIKCFEDAYAICGEDLLKEKIVWLKEKSATRSLWEAAKNAEAAGEYSKAADLYGQAIIDGRDSEKLLIRKAHCLVRAEKFRDAVYLFQNVTPLTHGVMYDYGFALAKAGRYHDCLKNWNSIESSEKDFLEQKKAVQSLLAADMYNRFNQTKDFAQIIEEGKSLVNSEHWDKVKDIVEYCRVAWIEELWNKEQYADIGRLLDPYPAQIDSAMLAFYAKTFFALAERFEDYLYDFTIFWLTAVYDHDILSEFSASSEDMAAVRIALIQKADELIAKYSNLSSENKSFKKALALWNIEKEIIKDIYDLAENKEGFSHLICTPQFAERFGRSSQALRLIRANKDYFSNIEHYLRTGAFYSSAAQSMFYFERGCYDEAFAALPGSVVKNREEAEFVEYCTERTEFKYGLCCLERGDAKADRYFENASQLFRKAPEYKKELIDRALDSYEDELIGYERILSKINSSRSTEEIRNALSLVMTRHAIWMYNNDRMNLKLLEVTIKKALELNPDNEYAQSSLNIAQIDIEIKQLNTALNKFRMSKACSLAATSEHQEVRDEFFNFIEGSFSALEEISMQGVNKADILKNLSKWCADVDKSHPLLYKIENKLARLEAR